LRFLAFKKMQIRNHETLKWSQELTGVGAETVSAHWASADAVPKFMLGTSE